MTNITYVKNKGYLKSMKDKISLKNDLPGVVLYPVPERLINKWFHTLSTSEWKIIFALSIRSMAKQQQDIFTLDFIVKETALSAPTVRKLLPLLLKKGLMDASYESGKVYYKLNREKLFYE